MLAMELLKCNRCHERKPVADFAWRRKKRGQHDSFCRPCRAAYKREHYQANKARYIKQARVQKELRRVERTLFLLEYFARHTCVDCGESDPVVLEFDHVDEKGEKAFEVARNFAERRWQDVLAEMEKCEVVCANCHRKRTAERRNALRWALTRQLVGWKRATRIELVPRPWKGRMQPLTPRPRDA